MDKKKIRKRYPSQGAKAAEVNLYRRSCGTYRLEYWPRRTACRCLSIIKEPSELKIEFVFIEWEKVAHSP